MAEITQVGEANFQAEVLSSPIPVLVDFTAVWCGPCKMLDPIIYQLAVEWQDKVKIVKLDVDDNADITMQYQILGVPTLMLFASGKPVQRVSGYLPKDRLIAKFAPHLAGVASSQP